ncbi:hypothetical protein BVY02_01960, partial [bacterium J17]
VRKKANLQENQSAKSVPPLPEKVKIQAKEQPKDQPKERQAAEQAKPQVKELAKKDSSQTNTGKKANPKTAKLRLNRNALGLALSELEEKREAEQKDDKQVDDKQRAAKFLNAQPFRRTLRSPGYDSFSYVPDIQDGEITLLNAKADRYAVFVSRVATQVFGALRRRNWSQLTYSETKQVRRFTKIEAVMSKQGKLLSATVSDSSGSRKFDLVVEGAAKDGTWDQNPPEGAEWSDGNIHFIFASKTWSRPGPEGLGEARWILLGTGLR